MTSLMTSTWESEAKWIQMFTNSKHKRILQSLVIVFNLEHRCPIQVCRLHCHFPQSAMKSASCIQNSDVRCAGLGWRCSWRDPEVGWGKFFRPDASVTWRKVLGINNESTYAGGETQAWSKTEGSARQARVCKPQSLVSCRRYEEQRREYVCGSKLSTGFH